MHRCLAAVLAASLLPPTAAGAAAARRVTVPNVVGRQEIVAQQRLRHAGLRSLVLYVHSLTLAGTVVAQKPKAGVRVRARTRVTISVSGGPGP